MGRRERPPRLTGADIIHGFCDRALLHRAQNKVYPNFYIGSFECDILEITKAGYSYEYEIKISRHDFNNDRKKREGSGAKKLKYDVLSSGDRVNYFSYVVPEGLIEPEEVPEFAGLIYARGYEEKRYTEYPDKYTIHKSVMFTTVKAPKRLKKDRVSSEDWAEIHKRLYFRYHQIRCKLNDTKLRTPFTHD